MTVTDLLLIVGLVLSICVAVFIIVVQVMFVGFAGRGLRHGKAKEHRESIKTSIFTLIGWSVFGCAMFMLLSANRAEGPDVNQRRGEPLFAGFEPIDVKRLEIVKYDSETNRFVDFRVEQQGQAAWRIPGFQNYPADRLEQVEVAANSLFNLVVVDIVPDDQADPVAFGVIEPDREEVQTGQEGVGIRVGLRDRNNKELADLVIGKPVKEREGQRFVRIPGQDPIYIVEFDPSVLKTDFQDWINNDLLLVEKADIASVEIRNYQVDQEKLFDYIRSLSNANVAEETQSRLLADSITWAYDFAAEAGFSNWSVKKLYVYNTDQQPNERPVGANEELNATLLDGVRNAIDALEIVDVARKPQALARDLANGTEFATDPTKQEQVLSLFEYGVFPVPVGQQVEYFSTNGELIIERVDGIEYILRFGRIRTEGTEADTQGALERFLMVTARINEDAFPPPIRPEAQGQEGSGVQVPTLDGNQDGDAQEDSNNRSDDLEYRRQVDDWTRRVQVAQAEAARLNARFADWYYVISEEAYASLKIPTNQIVIRKLQ